MRKTAIVAILAAGCGLGGPLAADDCAYQEPREERIDAAGLKTLRVIARAGSLRISGQAGASAVEVRGTACASSRSSLEDIRLRTARSGSTATVEVEIPDSWGWHGERRLDLVVGVPPGLALEVEDGSGAIDIRNVAAVAVQDGSGEIVIEGVAGEVRITDGSGSIDVRDAGSVVVDEDGSGGISVSGVRGNVLVRDDGSGSISVREVAGDFTVEDDGSGGISHAQVHGRVRVPSRD